jgi:diacylglycerol kinase (ATP)
MDTSNRFSLKKRMKSFVFAFNGLRSLFKREHNASIHLVSMLIAVVLGFYLHIELFEWLAISIVIALVFMAELFNTAIERLADFVEPAWNNKIGLIKDYCAAAVLTTAFVSLIVGGIIFIPKIKTTLAPFF